MSLWDSHTGENFQPELSLNPTLSLTGGEYTPSFQIFPSGKKAYRERDKFYALSDEKNLKKVISSQKDYYFKTKQKIQKEMQNVKKK